MDSVFADLHLCQICYFWKTHRAGGLVKIINVDPAGGVVQLRTIGNNLTMKESNQICELVQTSDLVGQPDGIASEEVVADRKLPTKIGPPFHFPSFLPTI